MKAGRDLDHKVISRLDFELEFSNDLGSWVRFPNQDPVLFRPSTNIADAWLVVEKLHEQRDWTTLETLSLYATNDKYVYRFTINKGKKSIQFQAKTAPLAICLASLKAVGAEIDE